jgi:circadian clock protein KaiC
MTALITAERGTDTMTRYGLEEYVSDCVIVLDHRVNGQISTRRLRVVKYRGSMHGTNEYPFIIDNKGFQLMPITSAALDYIAPRERYSTGIPELDEMLSGKGFMKGSTIMVSGAPGTGKTSIACAFANQVCKSNERCMYFALEESPNQIMRNMESIGINLEPCIKMARYKFMQLDLHYMVLKLTFLLCKEPLTSLIQAQSSLTPFQI